MRSGLWSSQHHLSRELGEGVCGHTCKGFSGGPSDLPGLVEGFHVLLVVAVLVGAGQEVPQLMMSQMRGQGPSAVARS